MRDLVGTGPLVEVRQAQGDRQEQDRQGQERDAGRLHRPADRQSPAAAHQVVEHRQAQAAQRDPDPEDVAHQVGVVERARGDQPGGRADGQPGRAGDQRQPPEAVQAEPQLVIGHPRRGIDAHGWGLRL